jgi:hypothetical protein
MDLKELGAWLFQPGVRDIFRLESLDGYISAGDEPYYSHWRRGLPVEVDESWAGWLNKIAEDSAAGITRRRVHAMSEPLTEHNLFECSQQYTRNGDAGEQIGIFTTTPEVRARMQDFWMLDHHRIAVMVYDGEGRFQSAYEPADPQPWIELAHGLWSISEPFQAWWAARPQYHSRREAA